MADDQKIQICSPVRYFADDIVAACDTCGCPVFYRPHIEAYLLKGTPRICTVCWKPSPDDEWFTTRESLDELWLLNTKASKQ